jgi:GTP cyclohydrolase I
MTPEEHLTAFLQKLGFDQDPECQNTANRVTEFLKSWSPHQEPPRIELCQWQGTSPVLLKDLRFYSLCAHHLLPFFGQVDIIHQPAGKIAGLGAFPKILKHFSQRPQIQERLCEQVAEFLYSKLGGAVLVRIKARHMCMELRGSENGALVETWVQKGEASGLRDLLR